MKSIVLGVTCALLLTVTACGAAAQDATKELPKQDPVANSTDYRIGREDVLRVVVWKNDALSQTVAVRPDGRISLPLLGDVEAAGLTPTELRDFVTAKLADFVAAPEVSVIVTDVQSLKVSVIGEVPKPGRYDLKSRLTVLDMLAVAGGLGQMASRTRIVILRPNGDAMKRIEFNYNRATQPGGEADNIFLQPGDIIVVP
ncbi:MAG: polysaccharide biosynthesis/export family protein [Candidatus Rokuibacteriota bacterium]